MVMTLLILCAFADISTTCTKRATVRKSEIDVGHLNCRLAWSRPTSLPPVAMVFGYIPCLLKVPIRHDKHRAMNIPRVPPLLWHKHAITKRMLHALWVFIACEYTLPGPPKETRPDAEMHVTVNNIITMYGNTKVAPAVHGCYGDFNFISGTFF